MALSGSALAKMGAQAQKVGKVQIGPGRRELLADGRLGPHKDRAAAGIAGAEHVDVGVTDEPDIRAGDRAGVCGADSEGVIHVLAARLVARSVAGAGQLPEML